MPSLNAHALGDSTTPDFTCTLSHPHSPDTHNRVIPAQLCRHYLCQNASGSHCVRFCMFLLPPHASTHLLGRCSALACCHPRQTRALPSTLASPSHACKRVYTHRQRVCVRMCTPMHALAFSLTARIVRTLASPFCVLALMSPLCQAPFTNRHHPHQNSSGSHHAHMHTLGHPPTLPHCCLHVIACSLAQHCPRCLPRIGHILLPALPSPPLPMLSSSPHTDSLTPTLTPIIPSLSPPASERVGQLSVVYAIQILLVYVPVLAVLPTITNDVIGSVLFVLSSS